MAHRLHGFNNGDRVTHTRHGGKGTVRVFEDAAPDEAAGEIKWDGSFVADELDERLAPNLRLI